MGVMTNSPQFVSQGCLIEDVPDEKSKQQGKNYSKIYRGLENVPQDLMRSDKLNAGLGDFPLTVEVNSC